MKENFVRPEKKRFAKGLKCEMKKQGVKGCVLADYLEVSEAAVSKWTRGVAMPSADNLICLCQILEVSALHLAGIE